jgi:endoglucanase
MRARAVLLLVASLAAALVGGGVVGPVPLGAASAIAASSLAPTPLVMGNRIIDSRTGATFVPHGANWPSFEYACGQGWGYSQGGDTDAAAAAMQSWGINTIRLPLNEDCWLGTEPGGMYGTTSGYRAAVQGWVDILHAHGILVILDLHWSAPPGQQALGQWPMADSQSPAFWTSVASAYASDPSVIFDLFNEPYSIWNAATNSYSFQLTWDCWENGGCRAPYVTPDQTAVTGVGAGSYTVVGMSALVAAVRAAHAQQPIMLGGLDYSNNLSGWLAHEPNDSQLIAAWHNYDGQNPSCNTTTCWDSTILPVAASVPVITGEFGETDGGTAWFSSFMNWADANGIGYLPWAWTDSTQTSGDDAIYSLYSGSGFTPHAPMGTTYRAHLALLPATPSGRVFSTQPAPMTAVGLGTDSASVPASQPPLAVPPTISAADVRLLHTSSQRRLRVSRR